MLYYSPKTPTFKARITRIIILAIIAISSLFWQALWNFIRPTSLSL